MRRGPWRWGSRSGAWRRSRGPGAKAEKGERTGAAAKGTRRQTSFGAFSDLLPRRRRGESSREGQEGFFFPPVRGRRFESSRRTPRGSLCFPRARPRRQRKAVKIEENETKKMRKRKKSKKIKSLSSTPSGLAKKKGRADARGVSGGVGRPPAESARVLVPDPAATPRSGASSIVAATVATNTTACVASAAAAASSPSGSPPRRDRRNDEARRRWDRASVGRAGPGRGGRRSPVLAQRGPEVSAAVGVRQAALGAGR